MSALLEPTQTTTKFVGGMLTAVFALALALIQPWEGYSSRPYRDIANVLTVCHGHTGNVENREYSADECGRLLASDMGQAWQVVERCISARMTDYQAAAMLSFAYNVGPGRVSAPGTNNGKDGLCTLKSGAQPRIRVYANQSRWDLACAQLPYWVFAGGQRSRGLANRRAAEQAMCEGRMGATP